MPTSKLTLTPLQMEIIRTLADNSMNLSATARELYRNRSGLRHHLERIHERTGLNPMNFYDLHELLYAEEVTPDDR